jgi:hypothetical protein
MRTRLMMEKGVTITLVPWLLDSSDLIYGRRSRPVPGQSRRGEAIRPHARTLARTAANEQVTQNGDKPPKK